MIRVLHLRNPSSLTAWICFHLLHWQFTFIWKCFLLSHFTPYTAYLCKSWQTWWVPWQGSIIPLTDTPLTDVPRPQGNVVMKSLTARNPDFVVMLLRITTGHPCRLQKHTAWVTGFQWCTISHRMTLVTEWHPTASRGEKGSLAKGVHLKQRHTGITRQWITSPLWPILRGRLQEFCLSAHCAVYTAAVRKCVWAIISELSFYKLSWSKSRSTHPLQLFGLYQKKPCSQSEIKPAILLFYQVLFSCFVCCTLPLILDCHLQSDFSFSNKTTDVDSAEPRKSPAGLKPTPPASGRPRRFHAKRGWPRPKAQPTP